MLTYLNRNWCAVSWINWPHNTFKFNYLFIYNGC